MVEFILFIVSSPTSACTLGESVISEFESDIHYISNRRIKIQDIMYSMKIESNERVMISCFMRFAFD